MKGDIIDSVVTTEKSRRNVRIIIPLLIHWAKLGLTNKTYGDIIKALGYDKFSAIGGQLYNVQNVIDELAKREKKEIPTLNSLAKSASTMLPSKGFEYVSPKYNKLDDAGKKIYIEGVDNRAIKYPHWNWVLKKLKLKPLSLFTEKELESYKHTVYGSGGEGEEHKQMKLYIYNHPESVGIENVIYKEMEHLLPSGDKLDVYFEIENDLHIAVEIKPSTSPEQDTFRGIFQCVKYKAVMDSYRTVDNGRYDNKTILVCAGKLPKNQQQLAEEFGIEVMTNFKIENSTDAIKSHWF